MCTHSAGGARTSVTLALLLGGLLLGEARELLHSEGTGRRRLRALQPSVGFHVATEEQWPLWPTHWPTADKTVERFSRYGSAQTSYAHPLNSRPT
jgi:hypothetical protein